MKETIINRIKNKTIFHLMTDIFSYLFFVFVCSTFIWLVFHNETRASIDFQMAPFIVFLLSIVIIIILGLLEGSQIAIINISEKHHSTISNKYITALQVQQMTKTKETVHHYLIGRQLMVVVLVIVFSLLTSFPNIDDETFNMKIPKVLNIIAFQLGLMNALILLWLGQLIPQLFANKAPQQFLNLKLTKYLVKLCFIVSASKVAKPSSLIVNLANVKDDVSKTSE